MEWRGPGRLASFACLAVQILACLRLTVRRAGLILSLLGNVLCLLAPSTTRDRLPAGGDAAAAPRICMPMSHTSALVSSMPRGMATTVASFPFGHASARRILLLQSLHSMLPTRGSEGVALLSLAGSVDPDPALPDYDLPTRPCRRATFRQQ